MAYRGKISIQESYEATLSDNELASFDIQTDFKPTKPLLHKRARFLYVVSGSAIIKIQDKIHVMKEGVLIALLPWQVSEILEVEDHVTYYLLVYSFDFINGVIKRDFNINDEPLDTVELIYKNNSVLVPAVRRSKIKSLFEDIRDEVGIRSMDIELEQRPYSSIYITARLTELTVFFIRLMKPEKNENEPMISESIFKYMYMNSSSHLNLAKLSKVFLMSESSISKYIQQMTGLGFYDLIYEMRLSKAQFLLLHTKLTLNEISALLHFYDKSQLSRAFSERHGIGTKAFRTANKGLAEIVNVRLDPRSFQIIDYIRENYRTEIDIVDVSEKFNMPPRAVNEVLKYFVEKNFIHFLSALRIHKAAEMLLNDDMSVTDIAYYVGYNSIKTFNRHFVSEMNMSPTEFKRKISEQGD